MVGTMNLNEYIKWREEFLDAPKGRVLMSPRGECIVGEQLMITSETLEDYHLRNHELEDAEYGLIFDGKDMSDEWKTRLYGDDDDLYNAYKSLNVHSLISNGKRRLSRKNIIFNKECCLCYWQLHGDELYVVSRSLDVQRAGKSDIIIVNRIAHDLGCTKWIMMCLNPHIYTDRSTIARRRVK